MIIINQSEAADIIVGSPGADRDIQPAIQAAVLQAAEGDRIILPAGNFIVNKHVLIEKSVSLIGQGLRSTILYRSEQTDDRVLSKNREWVTMIRFLSPPSGGRRIVVSGICFKSKKPSVLLNDGFSLAADIGVEFVRCVDFIVTDCRFEGFGDAALNVIHDDSLARGLIYGNQFYHNAKGPEALGLGYGVTVYGMNREWISDPRLGSDNFIFIEDNVFDFHRHSVAAGGCALYVFRHNTVLNNIAGSGGHAIDVHSARGPGNGLNTHGTRAVEIYHNRLLNKTYTDGSPIKKRSQGKNLEESGINIRSGDAVVYDNIIKGYRFGVVISNYLLQTHPPEGYPVTESPGYQSGRLLGPSHTGNAFPENDGDLFVWNNVLQSAKTEEDAAMKLFYNFLPQWWKEGRDYHLMTKPGYRPYPYPHPYRKNEK